MENKIPEVGDIWKHKGQSNIYKRLSDEEGRRRISAKNREKKDVFFSENCMNDNNIVWTDIGATDIVILYTNKTNKKGGSKMELTKIQKEQLDKDTQILVERDILDKNLNITGRGSIILTEILFTKEVRKQIADLEREKMAKEAKQKK